MYKSQELALAEAARAEADLSGLDDDLADDKVSLGAAQQSIMLPSPSEGYDAQLNAIKSLVAEDPGRVAQVVKEWISGDD